MRADIKVENLQELRKALKAAESELDKGEVRAFAREAADPVRSEAADRVAVSSGGLQDTIRVTGGRSDTVKVVAGGKSKVDYAAFNHFGIPSRNYRPNPFLYEALDRRKREVVDVFEKRARELTAKI